MNHVEILRECLREAGDDTEAGLLACEHILSNQLAPNASLDIALATDGAGHWITIGGRPDPSTGEKHIGGFRVFITGNGTITKGRLRGKNVSEVKSYFDKKKIQKPQPTPTATPTAPKPTAPTAPTAGKAVDV